MGFSVPGLSFAVGLAALLVIALIVLTGHCTFNGSIGLGLH